MPWGTYFCGYALGRNRMVAGRLIIYLFLYCQSRHRKYTTTQQMLRGENRKCCSLMSWVENQVRNSLGTTTVQILIFTARLLASFAHLVAHGIL